MGEPPRDARLVVLGGVGLEGGSGAGSNLPGRRAEVVFAYLAVENGRDVSRDELADALWPELLPDTWAAALRTVVTEVRRFLDDSGLDGRSMIASTGSGWQLRLPPGVTVDLDDARRDLAEARETLADEPATAATIAESVARVAALPFLPAHESEWAGRVRAELSDLRLGALETAAKAFARGGDNRAAVAAAERLVRADPYTESSHRLLISLHGRAGDRAGARRAYEACRTLLADELGVEPAAATERALQEALASTAEPSADPGARGLLALSVLIVDDHEFQRNAAAALLWRVGVETVHAVSSGEAALELMIALPRLDIVICDLDLPGMDGIELIRHIARLRLAHAVAIMSALDRGILNTVRDVGEAYGLNMLGVIEKPLTAGVLSDLLANYRASDEEHRADTSLRASGDALARRLDEGRLTVHLEPIVHLATGHVVAAEAFLRTWDVAGEPPLAVTLPPSVESSETAARLYDGIIDLACAAARELLEEGYPLQVAIGLPHPQLAEVDYAGLAGRFTNLTSGHGITPGDLALTVDETFALSASPMALEAMARLRLRGFALWLDDAGPTARLDRLPITAARMATDLVRAAQGGKAGQVRLAQAVTRAHSLGVRTTAARCEVPHQVAVLVEAGVDLAQGTPIAVPMPVDEVADWARAWDPSSLVWQSH